MCTNEPYKIEGDQFKNKQEKDLFNSIKDKIQGLKIKRSSKEILPFNVYKLSMNVQKNLANFAKERLWGEFYLEIKDEYWDIREDHKEKNASKEMKLILKCFKTPEEWQTHLDEYEKQIKEKYISKVGISELFNKLIDLNKIVIGYEMNLLFLITYHHLYDDLPENYSE